MIRQYNMKGGIIMDEEMLNNLSSMLKDGNIPDNIKDIMSNISKKNAESSNNSSSAFE